VTFNGRLARDKGQKVLYITDLGVFELTGEGLTLVEIAPGLDVNTDILPHIEFDVAIAPELKTTDPAVYHDRLGLRRFEPWKSILGERK
jgi:acyl CoA:acetate/3-ketoacid CoA transferase